MVSNAEKNVILKIFFLISALHQFYIYFFSGHGGVVNIVLCIAFFFGAIINYKNNK
jgi:hypothetical protein